MGVQSYLSLYTVLLGWHSYDILWHILTQLGLVMLPFAFIAVKSFMEPFLSMGAKDSGVIGSRRFIMHLFLAIFVMLFAGAPWVHLDPSVLHFRPHCEQSANTATPGHTGTTYDNLLPVPQDVKVPLIWYLVMAVSNGITDEAEDAISCPMVDLRALQNQLNLAVIQSSTLKKEVRRFYQACYLPAYNQFVSDNDKGVNQAAIQSALKRYGDNDIDWIGSLIFQRVAGFYDSFSANAPVVGFPYTSKGINNQVNSQVNTPKWDSPSCLAWWQTPQIGLRDKLYNQFSHKLQAMLAKIDAGPDHVLAENYAIRAVLNKSTGGGFSDPGFYTEQDNQGGIDNFIAKWFSKYAIDKVALQEYPTIQIIKNALPVVQAILSAACYMLLAIALPLASYSLRFVVIASVFIFSIIFTSFLWHWISWFDQNLLQALYSASPSTGHLDPAQLIWNLGRNALSPEKNLVDFVISLFYIALPGFWLVIVNWAGVAIGNAMNFGGADQLAGRASHKAMSGSGISGIAAKVITKL